MVNENIKTDVLENNMYLLINDVLKNMHFEECPLEFKRNLVSIMTEMYKGGYKLGFKKCLEEMRKELIFARDEEIKKELINSKNAENKS